MSKYQLMDGELQNALHPDTFEIMDRDSREALEPGDFAKLGFVYTFDDGEEDHIAAERMWVKVTDVSGALYTGTLNNQPLEEVLVFGEEVKFMPQHVLDVFAED